MLEMIFNKCGSGWLVQRKGAKVLMGDETKAFIKETIKNFLEKYHGSDVLLENAIREYEIEKQLKEILKDYNICDDASKKIKQFILVVIQIDLLQTNINGVGNNIDLLYNRAVKLTADRLGLMDSTVREKLERSSYQTAGTIQDAIKKFLEGQKEDLRDIVKKSIKNTRKEQQDKEMAREQLFKGLEI